MLKPTAAAETIDVYAQHVFIPYISSQLRSVSRVDLVWDTYKDDPLKGTARAKRRKGVRRRVVGTAAVPGNWHYFLRADSYKTELFSFLSNVLLQTRKFSSPMGRGAQHTAFAGCPQHGPMQPPRITLFTAWPPPGANSHC